MPQSPRHTPAERQFFEVALASLPSVPFASRKGNDPQRVKRDGDELRGSVDEEASVAFRSGAPDDDPTETAAVRPTPVNGFGRDPKAGASHRGAETPESGCPSTGSTDEAEETTAPTTPPRNGLSDEQQAELLRLYGYAHNIKHMTGPACLAVTARQLTGPDIPPPAFRVYMVDVLKEAGNPTDPVERMMIEQVTLAHHEIGRLRVQAALAKSPEEAKIYNASATALLAEFRRTALALKKYREPTPAKHLTVVKQQNVAQSQQVAFVNGQKSSSLESSGNLSEIPNGAHTELGSKRAIEYVPPQDVLAQPQASRGRQKEPVKTKRPHLGRPSETQSNGTCQPPVAGLDRSADSGWEGPGRRQWQSETEGLDVDSGIEGAACRCPLAGQESP